MLDSRELFNSITMDTSLDSEHWSKAITTLGDCQEAVTACAAAMVPLGADLSNAVLRDLDCADVVQATIRVLTRATEHTLLSAQLEACLLACERSHESCREYAEHHSHCRICAETTKECANVCRELLAAFHQ